MARSVWWRSTAAATLAGEEPEPLVEVAGDLDRGSSTPCAPRRARSPAGSRRAAGRSRRPRPLTFVPGQLPRPHRRRRSTNSRTAAISTRSRSVRRRRRACVERSHRAPRARRRRRAPRGSSPARARPGSPARSRRRDRRASSSRCSQLSSTRSSSRTFRYSTMLGRRATGRGAARSPSVDATTTAPSRRRRRPRPARTTTHRRRSAGAPRPRPGPRAGSCRRRRCRSRVTTARPSSSRDDACDVVVAPDERRELHRQVPRERVQRARAAGTRARAPDGRTWKTRSGRPRSRSACSPRSTSSTSAVVAHELRGRVRHHDLAAVRRAHQRARRGSPRVP